MSLLLLFLSCQNPDSAFLRNPFQKIKHLCRLLLLIWGFSWFSGLTGNFIVYKIVIANCFGWNKIVKINYYYYYDKRNSFLWKETWKCCGCLEHEIVSLSLSLNDFWISHKKRSYLFSLPDINGDVNRSCGVNAWI